VKDDQLREGGELIVLRDGSQIALYTRLIVILEVGLGTEVVCKARILVLLRLMTITFLKRFHSRFIYDSSVSHNNNNNNNYLLCSFYHVCYPLLCTVSKTLRLEVSSNQPKGGATGFIKT